MAHETIDYRDRIIYDPEIVVGRPVVKRTRIPVERVLERLVDHLDLSDLFSAFPELSRDDVRAVLAYARDKVADTPDFVSPQAFYREATQRDDVKRILDALAK